MFKVGDLVQIRHHTEDEKENYNYYWHPHMTTMEGNIYRIKRIVAGDYYIQDDRGTWAFMKYSVISLYEQF